MSSTIVTALYDIGREKIDGRKYSDYIEWAKKTLSLNCNFLIFTDKKTKELLNIDSKNVSFIIQELNEIPLYKSFEQISTILKSQEFKNRISDNGRIECIEPLYNIIQYSKFNWLKEAIKSNHFNSDYFFWMDAGCSRFFTEAIFSSNFPNLSKINSEKFLIQGNINTTRIPVDNDYIWKSDCLLVGTFFGGSSEIVERVSNLVLDFLENKMIRQNIINNEQIALAYVAMENLDIFDIFIHLDNSHLPILKYLQ